MSWVIRGDTHETTFKMLQNDLLIHAIMYLRRFGFAAIPCVVRSTVGLLAIATLLVVM